MLFHCFATFCISIRLCAFFFIACFTPKYSGLKFLIIQSIGFLSLVSYNKEALVGSEKTCEDSQWVSSIQSVWIRAVLQATREIDPRSLCRTSIGLVMVRSHFLECVEGSERDPFCISCSLSLSKDWLASEQRDLAKQERPSATQTKEFLVHIYLPVRCCWEIHSLQITANCVNSSSLVE